MRFDRFIGSKCGELFLTLLVAVCHYDLVHHFSIRVVEKERFDPRRELLERLIARYLGGYCVRTSGTLHLDRPILWFLYSGTFWVLSYSRLTTSGCLQLPVAYILYLVSLH